MRKYKTLSCEPSPGGVLDGNESEGPSHVLEVVCNKHPTETCFYWFDLLITERCLMGCSSPCPANRGRRSLQAFSGVNLPWQQESRTAPWDLATCSCRSFSLRSKGMAASKTQFDHSSRPVAIHSGRLIPWALMGGAWCESGISQLSWAAVPHRPPWTCCIPGLEGLEEFRFLLQSCWALLDVYGMLGLL